MSKMTKEMVDNFIDQTGLDSDAAEYASPERSQVDSMFYVGNEPWHRIGTKLDGEAATAEQAISAAGLNWKVTLESVYLANGVDTNRKAVVREDSQEVFQVGVTNRYVPLQNNDAFNFFDAVVGAGEAIYHTAGSMRGGRVVWILAKLPGDIGIQGDAAEKYIMLSNSHDGTQGVDMRFCGRRVVCQNTFKMALADSSQPKVRLRHTTNLMERVNFTRDALGLSDAYFKMWTKQADELANKTLTNAQAESYFTHVFLPSLFRETKGEVNNAYSLPYGSDHTELGVSAQQLRTLEDVWDLYSGDGMGSGLASANQTQWGAFNAVSEYLEHHKPMRTQNELVAIERRLNSSFWGDGAAVEQRAWDYAQSGSPRRVAILGG